MTIFFLWLMFVMIMGRLAWLDVRRINREYEKEIEAQNTRIKRYNDDAVL